MAYSTVEEICALSAEKLKREAAKLSAEEVSQLTAHLSGSSAKTAALIQGLLQRPLLEAAGGTLSVERFADLITHYFIKNANDRWKLSPLFVGFPPALFVDLLFLLPTEKLSLLKEEAVTEPVQHQLSLLIQDLRDKEEKLVKQLEQTEREFANLDQSHLSSTTADQTVQLIEELKGGCQAAIALAAKGLAIAWNTGRPDLIEGLSSLKEALQRLLIEGAGSPRSEKTAPTGLYQLLEERLFSPFDGMQDDEPAIEGLARLSVWYLRDYWELGLLPQVKRIEELELPEGNENRIDRRSQLFAQAKSTLAAAGLKSVLDLKKHWIVSKKTLRDFLSKLPGESAGKPSRPPPPHQ